MSIVEFENLVTQIDKFLMLQRRFDTETVLLTAGRLRAPYELTQTEIEMLRYVYSEARFKLLQQETVEVDAKMREPKTCWGFR